MSTIAIANYLGKAFSEELRLLNPQANLELLKDNFTLKVKVMLCSKII